MKKLAPLFFLLLVAAPGFAQQKPQYSQYLFNNYLLNPALSGIESYTDIRMGTRRQWVGIEGAPVTYYISGHTSLGTSDRQSSVAAPKGFIPRMAAGNNRTTKYHKSRPHHGFGAMAQSDKTGPLSTSNLTATYAYHHPLTRRVNMSVGISGGVQQTRLDGNALRLNHSNDPTLQPGQMARTKFDLGLGTWIYSDFFYVGASAAQLVSKKAANSEGLQGAQQELQPHFFLTSGYRLKIRYDLSLEPSIMVKYAQPSPVSVDFNLKTTYMSRIWAGVSYRHNDAVAALAGMNVNHLLDIGYSYDLTTSELSTATAGSHELIVGIKLLNKNKVICPQWLW
ncbi:type IX secretion system membrane protein PorP/SprF [Nibribacter ruber]|uniref:Type IX secretion system membrane protein PorP/SprF n=1 Tax=Nibribacter ruber TaxID=2698458 RepID=A0A6P1P489_9BACT|nr:type IX secretion system membrane protein PorP/SprF [Nibribacter ruber]QHL89201.1 type IX secretion system membrane protein PorP/SprF [Nibribacter ruber]